MSAASTRSKRDTLPDAPAQLDRLGLFRFAWFPTPPSSKGGVVAASVVFVVGAVAIFFAAGWGGLLCCSPLFALVGMAIVMNQRLVRPAVQVYERGVRKVDKRGIRSICFDDVEEVTYRVVQVIISGVPMRPSQQLKLKAVDNTIIRLAGGTKDGGNDAVSSFNYVRDASLATVCRKMNEAIDAGRDVALAKGFQITSAGVVDRGGRLYQWSEIRDCKCVAGVCRISVVGRSFDLKLSMLLPNVFPGHLVMRERAGLNRLSNEDSGMVG